MPDGAIARHSSHIGTPGGSAVYGTSGYDLQPRVFQPPFFFARA